MLERVTIELMDDRPPPPPGLPPGVEEPPPPPPPPVLHRHDSDPVRRRRRRAKTPKPADPIDFSLLKRHTEERRRMEKESIRSERKMLRDALKTPLTTLKTDKMIVVGQIGALKEARKTAKERRDVAWAVQLDAELSVLEQKLVDLDQEIALHDRATPDLKMLVLPTSMDEKGINARSETVRKAIFRIGTPGTVAEREELRLLEEELELLRRAMTTRSAEKADESGISAPTGVSRNPDAVKALLAKAKSLHL